MSYRKTSHSVYDLKYHVVWITKYRKPVLRGEIAVRLRELVRQTCAALDVYILSGHIAVDHVHLLVMIPPKVSVSDYCGMVKGRSAIRVFNKFKELKQRPYWGNHFWTEGYCVDTVGLDSEMIRKYVKYQEAQERRMEQGSLF